MPRRWMIRHLASRGLAGDRHGVPPRLFGGRELHMLVGVRRKRIVVGLLLIFHSMTCLPRQILELFEAVHRCPEPRSEGVQHSVAVSIAFPCTSDGSRDRKASEPRRIAISISRDAFLRSSRRSSLVVVEYRPPR